MDAPLDNPIGHVAAVGRVRALVEFATVIFAGAISYLLTENSEIIETEDGNLVILE